MNDEQRLSEDELADIRYRDELPILLVDVSEIRPATLTALIQQLQDTRLDRSALLLHTRALENELAIERAQSARGNWLGD